jgi:hypothetical protein
MILVHLKSKLRSRQKKKFPRRLFLLTKIPVASYFNLITCRDTRIVGQFCDFELYCGYAGIFL